MTHFWEKCQTDSRTNGWTDWTTNRKTDRQAGRQTNRQVGRQTDKQADKRGFIGPSVARGSKNVNQAVTEMKAPSSTIP